MGKSEWLKLEGRSSSWDCLQTLSTSMKLDRQIVTFNKGAMISTFMGIFIYSIYFC